MGAGLTSRRLLLVSATMRVIAATDMSPGHAPITSMLWAGPALLFCNAAQQVWKVISNLITDYRLCLFSLRGITEYH